MHFLLGWPMFRGKLAVRSVSFREGNACKKQKVTHIHTHTKTEGSLATKRWGDKPAGVD